MGVRANMVRPWLHSSSVWMEIVNSFVEVGQLLSVSVSSLEQERAVMVQKRWEPSAKVRT